MYKDHVNVFYIGSHPLDGIIKLFLVSRKFAFVNDETEADIVILGGNTLERPTIKNIPCLVLSSYEVFKGTKLTKPVREDDLASMHPNADFASRALKFLLSEQEVLSFKPSNTMVVRIFPLYGNMSPENFVSRQIKSAANAQVLYRLSYGHRVRAYLHVNDFCDGLERLIFRCLKNSAGIYNLGSTYQLSIQELSESIWNQFGYNVRHPTIDEEWVDRPWRPMILVPDMTRTFALTNWKPSVSLRQGLWELISRRIDENSVHIRHA